MNLPCSCLYASLDDGVNALRMHLPCVHRRWVHVVLFVPVSMIYLCWQATLIFVSWLKLAFCSLEWVPTARHANAETHHIRMSGKESGAR